MSSADSKRDLLIFRGSSCAFQSQCPNHPKPPSRHGIRLEGCKRSFRGEVLQLLHVLKRVPLTKAGGALEATKREGNKSAAPNKQVTKRQQTCPQHPGKSQKSVHSHPSFQQFDRGCLGMMFVYSSQLFQIAQLKSPLLDRFSLLGMCWKPFCTHLFWALLATGKCLFWGFPSLSGGSPK